ncbi:MAG TPA: hypothetical protein QGF58_19280 [Myxococcota bacterium]|nr:hypothetical protein [Myxococcota bacterium]
MRWSLLFGASALALVSLGSLARPAPGPTHDSAGACGDCHARFVPSTHTTAFRRPWESPEARDEHSLVASAHAGSCLTCHESGFHAQCAECHRPDEMSP